MPINPCLSNPCGPSSICKPIRDSYVCSCQPTFEGSPPNCRRECSRNEDCPSNKTCNNYKCQNPCPESCGINTVCSVRLHTVICSCQAGYTGDPFTLCHQAIETLPKDVCEPTPCGANSRCRVTFNNIAICVCEPNYYGNPYEGCRPECVINTDCPYNKACLKNKCEDPCPGVCGTTAICEVLNHLPTCKCSAGYTGNPYSYCHIIINEPG